jgi:hypothetical protein
MLAKYTDPIEIKNIDLLIDQQIKRSNVLVENQEKRFTIIKEEEQVRKRILGKMREETEIIPVESLGKLPDIEIMDKEYLMLQNQYATNLQILRTNQDQFMSEFLQYIEFHEDLLNLYKRETNEMYIQTAVQITQQHNKEIEMRKEELIKCEKKRQELEIQEELYRDELNGTYNAIRLFLSINDLKAAESKQSEYDEKQKILQQIEAMIKQCEKEETNIRDTMEYEQNVNFDSNIIKSAEINMNMFEKIDEINKKAARANMNNEENLNRNTVMNEEKINNIYLQNRYKEMQNKIKRIQKGKQVEPTITTPITEPIETPEDDEIIQYSGSRVYTEAPTYETAPIQYIQPPEQYRLNTATSSISQITPQPISEIRHIINKVAAGTQTQPLGIANMDEIKNLIKKYPDMKDIIVNSLLSELVKNKNVKREDIENIKHLSSTFNQPFTARSYSYAQNPNVIQKMAIFKKPQNLQDYENIVPPYTVRRNF